MKVAAIYSGEARTFENCHASHDEFFDGCEVDSYHSSWTKDQYVNQKLIQFAPKVRAYNVVHYTVPTRPDATIAQLKPLPVSITYACPVTESDWQKNRTCCPTSSREGRRFKSDLSFIAAGGPPGKPVPSKRLGTTQLTAIDGASATARHRVR